jgi:hypothetical protein
MDGEIPSMFQVKIYCTACHCGHTRTKLFTSDAVPTALHKPLLLHIHRNVTEQSVGMGNPSGTLNLLLLSTVFNPNRNSK